MIESFKPKFWEHVDSGAQVTRHMFNFRRIWSHGVIWTSMVSILPLIALALADYNVTQQSIESEILLRTSRLVSNTRRTLSFFLVERRAALDFIVQDNRFEALNSESRLNRMLTNLKESFGGFADLGIIDQNGRQNTYVGPYNLLGKDYSQQEWFQKVCDQGVYISDVFKGYRNVPHMVIAVRSMIGEGGFYILRATVAIEQFNQILAHLEITGQGDAFIVNHKGVLQTPSRSHGNVLEKMALPVPLYDPNTVVVEGDTDDGERLIIGYAYIEQSPFILMIVKQKEALMAPWYITRKELFGFLGVSLALIVVVILCMTTYLVNSIFLADQKRVMSLHHIEYANKMASVGRLAAGVAHEINNPLAIINEKAGLIKDLLSFGSEVKNKQKLIGSIDAVSASVDRCAAITHRLLNFARHVDVTIQPVNLEDIVREVLGFLGKEAEYRCIEIIVSAAEDIPKIESDRGKLQQIFLNLFNNAFAAMSDGGRLQIDITRKGETYVLVTVEDNGCGIPESDLKRIFDPFFSTKTKVGGTGLGLSITYGLVHELGGDITVSSVIEHGTKFYIKLPLVTKEKKNASHSCLIGG